MKKIVLLLLALFVLTLSSTVSAKDRHHDWSHAQFHDGNWHQVDLASDRNMPFWWHKHHSYFVSRGYYMERISDRDVKDRFPGLHAYKWHGNDFWYHGRHITNAVLFYDDSDELVSVGFWDNGAFIMIRDDDHAYESHDSFFLAWTH